MKEDKHCNTWLVTSSYVLDASTLLIYFSIVQNLSLRPLLLITKVNNLKFTIGDISNACINATTSKKVYSRASTE